MATKFVSTYSLDALKEDPSGVAEAASTGPVLIVREGSHLVLLTEEEYQRLGGPAATILDLLAMPGIGEIDFEPPRMDGIWHHDVDFSD